MKSSMEFIAHAAGSGDVKQRMQAAKSADDLVKVAKEAGFEVDRTSLSAAMRNAAGAELKKKGFPDWAVDSMFLGDAVCW